MATPISFLLFAVCLTFPSFVASTPSLQGPIASGRLLSTSDCGGFNPIDDCWRSDSDWEGNRQKLASCALGFGEGTNGGRGGEFYVVTDSGDDDPVTPKEGTLRYGVIQDRPLWIIFDRDMQIKLSQELIINSHKTLDGRGALVEIAYGPCLTIQDVHHVIISNIHIHDCVPAGNTDVRSNEGHYGHRGVCDGDGISILNSSNVWVDHCTMSKCSDGLIDAVLASNKITISNNLFSDHNDVMLLGHSDDYFKDRRMHVTVAYNRFGEGLVQRMPRCRHGYCHVVNNDYIHWLMYAIGGSANPTILSQGNRFTASGNRSTLEVTKHEIAPESEWKNWPWKSEDDEMINGAYFTSSGPQEESVYKKAMSLEPFSHECVGYLTRDSGILSCKSGQAC